MLEGIGLDVLSAVVVFLVEWGLMFFGTMLTLMFTDYAPADTLGLILYLVMGWMITPIISTLQEKFIGYGLLYMVLGGLSYTGGVVFFKLGKNVPIYHVVWHVFVMFGTGFIFIATFY